MEVIYDPILGALRKQDIDANVVEVTLDFLDTTAFVYNCPEAMKFTSQISEAGAATLSPVLDTALAQFDKVTITPAEAGLVILKGILL